MAEILPFRALHYHTQKVGELERVVTQPYDKISAEMQARYLALSPYNAARIIRGAEGSGASPDNNVYTRAAAELRQWIRDRVLVSESEPALYPYYQDYIVPGQPESKRQRRGFIALCRLEDYSARIVHRHEETLTGPKADRLELLKATRAHFGQIFMLYSDPGGQIESALGAEVRGPSWESAKDEYSTIHSVWRVTDPQIVERVVEAMRTKNLVIADGHHRYETALQFRDDLRAQGRDDARADYVMVSFVRLETDGLTILPTHRVLHNLEEFDWKRFLAQSTEFFEWEELDTHDAGWRARFNQRLSRAGGKRRAFGVYAGPSRAGILSLRRDFDPARVLSDVAPNLCRLDVVILHRLILEKLLNIDRQAVREEKHLRYVRDFDGAISQVEGGEAEMCFLLNPTRVSEVWENALEGRALPQKSTDFYPKLLSGLAIYWLDNPNGM